MAFRRIRKKRFSRKKRTFKRRPMRRNTFVKRVKRVVFKMSETKFLSAFDTLLNNNV